MGIRVPIESEKGFVWCEGVAYASAAASVPVHLPHMHLLSCFDAMDDDGGRPASPDHGNGRSIPANGVACAWFGLDPRMLGGFQGRRALRWDRVGIELVHA